MIVPADTQRTVKQISRSGVLRPENGSFFEVKTIASIPYRLDSPRDPAPADFDGDGKADTAVFRASTGTWLCRIQWRDDNPAVWNCRDLPVAGDYDGDFLADIAIYVECGPWVG